MSHILCLGEYTDNPRNPVEPSPGDATRKARRVSTPAGTSEQSVKQISNGIWLRVSARLPAQGVVVRLTEIAVERGPYKAADLP